MADARRWSAAEWEEWDKDKKEKKEKKAWQEKEWEKEKEKEKGKEKQPEKQWNQNNYKRKQQEEEELVDERDLRPCKECAKVIGKSAAETFPSYMRKFGCVRWGCVP